MDDFNEKKNDTNENGYTVTPDGGFYTKQKSDIIQDDTFVRPEANHTENKQAEETAKTKAYSSGYDNTKSYYQQSYYNPQGFADHNVSKKASKVKVKKQHRYGAGVVAVAAVLAAFIGFGSSFVALKYSNKDNTNNTVSLSSGLSGQNVNINVDQQASNVVEAVATKVTPSVVGIRTTTSVQSFFGGNSESTGEGSGVVYTADGYIITNYHVISGAISGSNGSKIEVFLDSESSESYKADVVGYNISSDLAVLKINVSGLTPVEIGSSENLKLGQYVITVGNPGGLEFMDSVTYGVISGLNRVVSSNSDVPLIQTDAAINPGNSGGALVDTEGKLVGINSSKIVSEEFEGMGFAIPVDTVIEVCKNIIEKQNDPEPYIGISISEKYTAEVLKYYGYPTGAVILSVADGSPAKDAGLQKGDIITEFNGSDVTEYNVINKLLEKCSPGDSVSVKIYRSGRYYTTTIKIGSNNAEK